MPGASAGGAAAAAAAAAEALGHGAEAEALGHGSMEAQKQQAAHGAEPAAGADSSSSNSN